jgi:hypothetical protein
VKKREDHKTPWHPLTAAIANLHTNGRLACNASGALRRPELLGQIPHLFDGQKRDSNYKHRGRVHYTPGRGKQYNIAINNNEEPEKFCIHILY